MKNKKMYLLLIFVIVAAWTLVFLSLRHWYTNSILIPARAKARSPIAEFNQGASIQAIAFSPTNSDLIAVAEWGHEVKIWNVNNTDTPEVILLGHTDKDVFPAVDCLAFSPTGKWLARKTFKTLDFWDMPSRTVLNPISCEMRSFSAAISPVNPILATGLNDVKLWDISNLNEIKGTFVLPTKIGEQALSHEDIIWTKDHYTDRAVKHHNETINQHYKFLDFSHDGKWIAAGGQMNDVNRRIGFDRIKIWDLQSKQLFKIIEGDLPDDFKLGYYYADINTIKFSPDNRFFVVVGKKRLIIWSLPEWKIHREVDEPGIVDIAFSPDGKMFVTSSYRRIKIWLEEGQTPIDLQKDKDFLVGAKNITFSQDGSMLAGSGFDGVLRLWDVRKLNEK